MFSLEGKPRNKYHKGRVSPREVCSDQTMGVTEATEFCHAMNSLRNTL